jgi:hypothetical protein
VIPTPNGRLEPCGMNSLSTVRRSSARQRGWVRRLLALTRIEFNFIAVRLDVGDIPFFPRLLEGICGRWLGSFLPWSFRPGVRPVGLEGHDFVPLRRR